MVGEFLIRLLLKYCFNVHLIDFRDVNEFLVKVQYLAFLFLIQFVEWDQDLVFVRVVIKSEYLVNHIGHQLHILKGILLNVVCFSETVDHGVGKGDLRKPLFDQVEGYHPVGPVFRDGRITVLMAFYDGVVNCFAVDSYWKRYTWNSLADLISHGIDGIHNIPHN